LIRPSGLRPHDSSIFVALFKSEHRADRLPSRQKNVRDIPSYKHRIWKKTEKKAMGESRGMTGKGQEGNIVVSSKEVRKESKHKVIPDKSPT